MSEDYGWLGVGGDFTDAPRDPADAPRDPAQLNRHLSLMARVVKANRLLGEGADTERWRAHTGLRSLYLVLTWSDAVDQPDIAFLSSERGTRMYTVDYDWFSSVFADKGTGPWTLAGHLALVLAEISAEDGIALPLPR